MMVLNSIDNLILNQFEKVNQWSHKKFGKTKYDLAQYCDDLCSGVTIGGGTYIGIMGYLAQNTSTMGVGALLNILGAGFFSYTRKRNQTEQEVELEYVEQSGASPALRLNCLRPIFLLTGEYFVYRGVLCLNGFNGSGDEELIKLIGQENYSLLGGLGMSASGLVWLFNTASDYFRSCTMFPPKKQKSKLLDKIKSFFRPTSELSPQPVEPNGMPFEYQIAMAYM